MVENIKPIIEELKEYICDNNCALPNTGIPQETADTICEKCRMEELLNQIENRLSEMADQVDKLYLEKCKEVNKLKEQNSWIPVSERLPETTAYYLVTQKNIKRATYAWFILTTKKWEYLNSNKEMGDVIAWMPLSEPYKG